MQGLRIMFTTQEQLRQLDELRRLCQEWGGIVSPGGAANYVGVSRQAVNSWMVHDTIRHVKFRDLGVYVSLSDCTDRKKGLTGKPGRPKVLTE
jgi:hypothetical protein